MANSFTLTGNLDTREVEDSGNAVIYDIEDPNYEQIFIRIQSWDENKVHRELDDLLKQHKRVRITIEPFD